MKFEGVIEDGDDDSDGVTVMYIDESCVSLSIIKGEVGCIGVIE
jgi:hypothetical protein